MDTKTFTQFLGAVEDGKLHHDLTEGVAELVTALRDTADAVGGKPKGKLTLTLDFTLDRDTMEITGDLQVKKPKIQRGRSIFWTMPGGGLSRMNPKQRELFQPVERDDDAGTSAAG
jgi:hypothetical protein